MGPAYHEEQLIRAIEAFLDGIDVSLEAVNKIEGLIAEHFSDDDRFNDTLLALALYRPGGGDFLYDQEQLSQELAGILQILKGD